MTIHASSPATPQKTRAVQRWDPQEVACRLQRQIRQGLAPLWPEAALRHALDVLKMAEELRRSSGEADSGWVPDFTKEIRDLEQTLLSQ